VNDRFIKSAYLNHAIASAFEGLLKAGTHASYFLNLTVNPQTIDINIHPTKTEIKFDDEHTLYALLRSAVKHSLGQFNIAPVLDFERDPNLDTPYSFKKESTEAPKVDVDRSFNPFKEEKASQARAVAYKKEPTTDWEGLYVGLESKGNDSKEDFTEVQFESEARTGSIFDDSHQVEQSNTTYQIHNKYIVSTIKSGMLVIDQHRAHQRVLYEDFLKNLTIKEASSQQLLFPLQLHFSPQDIVIIKQLKNDLEHTGFVFSSVKEEAVDITGVPVGVPESEGISETVKHLLIINVIMFVGTLVVGGGNSFYEWFAMYFPKNDGFKPLQIITHMFMHGSPSHILFNMFALWMFGTPVEQALGGKRFLFLYISAGLGAVLLQVGFYYFQYLPMESQALALGATPEQIVEVFKEGKVFTDIGQDLWLLLV